MAKGAEARIARARELARTHAAAAHLLTFYADLTELQQALPGTLDVESAADAMPSFLAALVRIAPPPLADGARILLEEGHDRWKHLLHACWQVQGQWESGGEEPDAVHAFIAEAMLQPVAERTLTCEGMPVVAVLRDKAHGSERSFVCGFCLTEYRAARLGCPACGEARFEKLAVFRVDGPSDQGSSPRSPTLDFRYDLSAARIDACDTCRTYLKTIDLTRDATAVPVVDDIATVTLDVWARQQGYTRVRPNVLRV